MNLSCSKNLQYITEGEFSFMFYLQPRNPPFTKKPITTAVRKKASVKKKKLQISVNLEDHPNDYCIEDYTDLARDSRHKSAEEKQCQRFLCKICNSYRTVLIESLRWHIQMHING